MSSISPSFHFWAMVNFQPHWKLSKKNSYYWVLPHSKGKLLGFSSFTHEEDALCPAKQKQIGYDPSEKIIGVASELHLRKVVSGASKPRSWFGPNGQYARELPCSSCTGRGYTPCNECGTEKSRTECSVCNGKGITTCHRCFGDRVVCEESIDERPWEDVQSISPFIVKEENRRVYRSPDPDVSLKTSRSLKSLNAKTQTFSKTLKIIHGDPVYKRVTAIKVTGGSATARKHAPELMKKYFEDPEDRRKRSLSIKAPKFYCRNCGREGHKRNYCPDIKDLDRRYKCRLCGENGHNRMTCQKGNSGITGKPRKRATKNLHCRICRQQGHNRRTCAQNKEAANSTSVCRLCLREGHNRRTCSQRRSNHGEVSVKKATKNQQCRICGQKGHNRRTCPQNRDAANSTSVCRLCLTEGHNRRTCPQRRKLWEAGNTERARQKSKLIVPMRKRKAMKNQQCRTCGQKGHNRRTCPENKDAANSTSVCRLCLTKGHNRRTCPQRSKLGEVGNTERARPKSKLIVPTRKRKATKNQQCRICGQKGHNRRTCPENNDAANSTSVCRLCLTEGHNRRTCPQRSKLGEVGNTKRAHQKSKLIVPMRKRKATKNQRCRICGQKGHNRRTCPENKDAANSTSVCSLCFREGHNRRTCPQRSQHGEVAMRKVTKNKQCGICGQKGHNRRTCAQNKEAGNSTNVCRLCLRKGHNRRTCPQRSEHGEVAM